MMVHIQEVKNTEINVTILNENELVRPKLDQKSSLSMNERIELSGLRCALLVFRHLPECQLQLVSDLSD